MTAHPSARRYYLVYVRESADEPPTLILRTRSGPAAIAAAEPIGGWVEGDDYLAIWPMNIADGEGFRWAMMRRWQER